MIDRQKSAKGWVCGGVLLTASLFFSGCGKPGQLAGLVPAKGAVKYNGAVVEGATIAFIPDGTQESEQRTASALSDAEGKFAMMTLQPEDGAFPGTYKVLISKAVPDRVYTQEEVQGFFRQGMPTPMPSYTHHLPEKYSKWDSTPLSITLGKKGDKNIVFELAD